MPTHFIATNQRKGVHTRKVRESEIETLLKWSGLVYVLHPRWCISQFSIDWHHAILGRIMSWFVSFENWCLFEVNASWLMLSYCSLWWCAAWWDQYILSASFVLKVHRDWYVSARWPILDAKGRKKVKLSCSACPKQLVIFCCTTLCISTSQNQQINHADLRRKKQLLVEMEICVFIWFDEDKTTVCSGFIFLRHFSW